MTRTEDRNCSTCKYTKKDEHTEPCKNCFHVFAAGNTQWVSKDGKESYESKNQYDYETSTTKSKGGYTKPETLRHHGHYTFNDDDDYRPSIEGWY